MRRDEAITTAGQSFNEPWIVGGIVQRLAQFLDGVVQALVEIHEGIGRPDSFLEFFAGNHFTGMLEENLEDLKGLNLEFEAYPVLAQLTGTTVGIEVAETEDPLR